MKKIVKKSSRQNSYSLNVYHVENFKGGKRWPACMQLGSLPALFLANADIECQTKLGESTRR